jgi:hypothetical protein
MAFEPTPGNQTDHCRWDDRSDCPAVLHRQEVMFSFNQSVMTPNGRATFIGYLGDGHECQVSRWVPATELSKDECVARKPSLAELQQIEFINWQRTAKFCINEVYATGVIADLNAPRQTRPQPVPVSQVVDVAL